MKPRNLYRIVIGILFIITGAVTILSTPGNIVIPAILLARRRGVPCHRDCPAPPLWR